MDTFDHTTIAAAEAALGDRERAARIGLAVEETADGLRIAHRYGRIDQTIATGLDRAAALLLVARVVHEIEAQKTEIAAMAAAGDLPADLDGMSALHDHVDANTLGTFCDDEAEEALRARFGVGRGAPDATDAFNGYCNGVMRFGA